MKWLDRELIGNPFYMCLCKDEKGYHRALRHLEIPKTDWPEFVAKGKAAAVKWCETKGGKKCAIVCITKRRGRTRAEIDALLVHEAVHIWQWIREDLDEKHPSSEFEAYAIQRLSLNLIAAYHQKPKRKTSEQVIKEGSRRFRGALQRLAEK